jgi:hypothetical protein
MMSQRRLFKQFFAVCWMVALGLSISAASMARAADAPRKPNIVVILADDME